MPPSRIPLRPFRSTRFVVCLFVLLVGTAGCHQRLNSVVGGKPVAVASPEASSGLLYDAPGLAMSRRLELVAENVNPDEVINENRKKAEKLKAQLEGETDSQILFSLLPKYADELLSAGQTDEALKQYDRLEALARKQNAGMLAGNLSDMRRMQALAWLRLGEQENCLLNHTSESCLLPIQGGGIHKAQRGSRNAVKLLSQSLQADGKNLEARWLLNIAYMTLGEYPAKVPPKWLIPPSAFKSDYDIGRFHDIAGGLGLDLHRLSGGDNRGGLR